MFIDPIASVERRFNAIVSQKAFGTMFVNRDNGNKSSAKIVTMFVNVELLQQVCQAIEDDMEKQAAATGDTAAGLIDKMIFQAQKERYENIKKSSSGRPG